MHVITDFQQHWNKELWPYVPFLVESYDTFPYSGPDLSPQEYQLACSLSLVRIFLMYDYREITDNFLERSFSNFHFKNQSCIVHVILFKIWGQLINFLLQRYIPYHYQPTNIIRIKMTDRITLIFGCNYRNLCSCLHQSG